MAQTTGAGNLGSGERRPGLRRLPRFPAGRSDEHRAAFAQLRTLADPLRLRVQADPEGSPVIPGRYGQVEWFDPTGGTVAVYTSRPRLFGKLLALPGVQAHQTGEGELRALCPPEALPQVAGVIWARRRRASSPEVAQRFGARRPHRATSRP